MNLFALAVVIISGLGESLARAFSDLGHVPQCLVAYPDKSISSMFNFINMILNPARYPHSSFSLVAQTRCGDSYSSVQKQMGTKNAISILKEKIKIPSVLSSLQKILFLNVN